MCMYVHMCVYVCVCTHVYMCVYVHMCVYVLYRIAVEAFSSLFDLMELCSLSPDSLNDSSSNGAPSWSLTSYEGSWVPGCSAGGSRRYRR